MVCVMLALPAAAITAWLCPVGGAASSRIPSFPSTDEPAWRNSMNKKVLLGLALVGLLVLAPLAMGAFTASAPCSCCGDACACEDCACDAGGCACNGDCCTTWCAD
jgi:hypothetical protein